MNNELNNADPIPPSEYPSFQTGSDTPPVLPDAWECLAVMMPFSPLQSNGTPAEEASPFFELCVAYINYQENDFLSAQITGISGRTWWYVINENNQTSISTDQGNTWYAAELGWNLPTTSWFGNEINNATCAGQSPLNWMPLNPVNWWKMPVPGTNPPAATWMWFDANTNLPTRLMFGQGPTSPLQGDPNQLALFQMFSFSYFSYFNPLQSTSIPSSWTDAASKIEGFNFGNPSDYKLFTWDDCFGMTVFMTPVNENFNPLPTRVLYQWKPDNQYQATSDRSQDTLMLYTYNQGNPGNPGAAQAALLTGPAPNGVTPPPNSGEGFLINYDENGNVTGCVGGKNFPFPEEPPWWAQIPAEEGAIWATVYDNPGLCPGNTVTIIAVLFPPSPPNYPDSTFLWTWYSPLTPDGSSSRPVTFMQSQSGVGVGTSLALADYFFYEEYDEWLDPSNFAVPPACDGQTKKEPETEATPETPGYE